MKHQVIHLKDLYPFLGENNADPTVECFFPYNMTEMHRENTKRPCLVLCPGGGYGMCSQREGEPIAVHFLPKGFNVFVLTYSVAPYRFPTQIRQVAAVFDMIKANADEWNCDVEKIAVMGFSAGGHLAAHYSVAFDCAEVREVFPESVCPFASILGYPVITSNPVNAHQGSFKNLTGQEYSEELFEKFSCEKLVNDNTPQAFIWHTAADDCVPVVNSILYANALTSRKIPVELHIYPYGWHGMATVDKQTNDNLPLSAAHARQWLDSLDKWIDLTFYEV